MIARRTLVTTALVAPVLALPGCASLGDFGFVDAIRRLLTLSSQRAFDRLLQPGGFYDDQLARISLPPQLGGPGGSSVAAAILRSGPFRERLQRQLNLAAAQGAERAAPIVYDAIRGMSIADAISVVRGGPEATTALLREQMGDALIQAMVPGVGSALRLGDDPVVAEALRLATGIDIAGLTRDVAAKASDGIYRAVGREEAAIRANPRETGDPALIGVFGVLR